MSKRLTIILLLFVSISANPQSLNMERLETLISSFFDGKDFVLSKSTAAYSIFSSIENNNFVIISSEYGTDFSVLGYSDSGVWDENNMPPALLHWLSNLENRHHFIDYDAIKSKRSYERQDIPILLTSRWHQDSPYNDMCPRITDGNIKTAAGCVAIASAQVVYYWRKDNPQVTSEDTPTYPYGKAPVTYSIPAGTDYKWDLMRDYYLLYESEEEKQAVAQLVYIIGTSTYLQYGTSTGGQINDIINPFSIQFRLNAKFASKKNYSQEEWEQLIYNNLKKKQPVVYAGSTGTDAHAVVIDGYNADTNLFHFNFGWGGSGDGYYSIDDISGMNGYNLGQECVYDIYPRQKNLKVVLNVADELKMDSPGKIDLFIQNGSTFDIDGLFLYVSKNFMYPTNKDEAIWHQDGKVNNDGNEYSFSVQFTPIISGPRCCLILTDGDMNVLAQKNISIQESSNINEIKNAVESMGTCYSINGSLLQEKPNKGIYIKKNKKGATKVAVSK